MLYKVFDWETCETSERELTAQEVIDLSSTHDVMVLGAGQIPGGTRKHPLFREMPTIFLDRRDGRFRQR